MLVTIESDVHFERGGRGSPKELHAGLEERPTTAARGRVPRVSRLMALAIRFDGLLRAGSVGSYAELAELGHVSRARISQIMNLLNLAPDLQEEVLFLPRTKRGRDPIHLRQLQPIAAIPDWKKQRIHWRSLAVLSDRNGRVPCSHESFL
jgi:hypothetical protein